MCLLYFTFAEQGRAWHLTPPPYWKVTVAKTWHLAPDTSASPPATVLPSPSAPSQNRLLLKRRKSRSPTTALHQSRVCENCEGVRTAWKKTKLKPLLRTVKAQDCESVVQTLEYCGTAEGLTPPGNYRHQRTTLLGRLWPCPGNLTSLTLFLWGFLLVIWGLVAALTHWLADMLSLKPNLSV